MLTSSMCIARALCCCPEPALRWCFRVQDARVALHFMFGVAAGRACLHANDAANAAACLFCSMMGDAAAEAASGVQSA